MLFFSLIMTFLASLVGIGAYIYFWRQGQFDDLEDVKYQMFRQEENNVQEEE